MADTVKEVMSTDPQTIDAGATLDEAARLMKEHDVGPVLVTEQEKVTGIVTDRDIVVRAIAEGKSPDETKVSDVSSAELETLTPDDSVDDAVQKMRQAKVRRLPVVEDGKPVGIVSIGDLASDRDRDSVLAEISAAEPNE